MAHKQLFFESPFPLEKTYSLLCDTAEQLSRGKTKKDILDMTGVFDKGGRWWITNKDNEKYVLKMWYLALGYHTVYINIYMLSLSNGNTFVTLNANSYGLFDLFGQMSKPLQMFKETFDLRKDNGVQ